MNWDSWEDPKNSLTAALYRLDVDQCLRGNFFRILGCHSFTNHSFHSGQTDTVLVLEQFAHGPDTSVAQMVDIVIIANSRIPDGYYS